MFSNKRKALVIQVVSKKELKVAINSDVVRGDAFICYSHGLQIAGDCDSDDHYGRWSSSDYGLGDSDNGYLASCKLWIHNEECDNWIDHKYCKLKSSLDKLIPISIFNGKKEGDTVTFRNGGQTIVLTLKQLGSRFNGNFEDILMSMADNHASGDREPKWCGDISQSEQKRIIKSAVDEYRKSIE
jgi:hypothetical protein